MKAEAFLRPLRAWRGMMTNMLRQLAAGKKGVTAIEYGLIAGLIAVVIIGAVTISGQSLSTMFGVTATKLEAAAATATAAQ
jgi:pilus assembly protein Flp/PilA